MENLNTALRIIVEEIQASQGALFLRHSDGTFGMLSSCGLRAGAPFRLNLDALPEELTMLGPEEEVRHGFTLLCPIHARKRPVAMLALGPRAGGLPYGEEEHAFLRSVAACAATPIENGLIHDELREVNRQLSVKLFQIHNLFDMSRDLTGTFEEEAIHDLIMTTVMGHFVVSRSALFRIGPRGLGLVHQRGLRRDVEIEPMHPEKARALLQDLPAPKAVAELQDGPLRRLLEQHRLSLAVPLTAGERIEGVLAIGERASRTPFSPEDREFAHALARQALAALESARLHQIRIEKQRRDHELQVAREIQQSLFPSCRPDIAGFDVAAESRPCYEVGGDCYDWIHLGNGRLALVVADVSGKGTPASLLMASVHASMQALAGTATPVEVVERLNRFLFGRTQANRYVTLFYAELDPPSRRLHYVNAGHVPPYRIARDGAVERLAQGGFALGLFDEAIYDAGQVRLDPGDVVAMVTDGATEANSPDEREFGDERVCETIHTLSGGSAFEIKEGLVAAVNCWTGEAGSRDDLTVLILKAL
jgi:sigma-B regulation protein RsbU (phosphoserine phosphatase)